MFCLANNIKPPDPKAGGREKGIPSGTPFEKLLKGWVCPPCGAGKDIFAKGGLF
nr:rubredoxin [Desulfofundulus thermobenzoicus]